LISALAGPAPGNINWTYYFRTHFNFDFHFNSLAGGTLMFTHLLDDGAIFYLNGAEIARYNMPVGPATASDPALFAITNAACVLTSINTTNLLAGDNVLAVEVHQRDSADAGADVMFGTTLTFDYQLISPLPPRLAVSRSSTNQIVSWTNVGNLFGA